ncbi:MAG TPA: glycoside hydrolase family 3 N-terminal domain-containing protein [Arachnia sp.]|nr:glycoside hydrolase family 3 N-terminal domain-containing protein [Arachnia sp.]HMR12681.1 glycoside hydrolase family 3 N-terminal domain-containing protein [Arachnia sp.]
MPGPDLKTLTAPDGTVFRDLDHDGVMAPFEDPRLSAEERAADLLARLSPAEKAGLMFHNVIEMGEGGALLAGDGAISRASTEELVAARFQNHFNVHAMQDVRASCRWYNAIQEVAATTPHSIPVTISSDPRHSVTENAGAGFMSGDMSSWPEPLGLAALNDAERVREFADIVRQEYVAVGIRSALHPQIDLGTEPRWGRQYHTFGNDAEAVADAAQAYVEGLQGAPELGAESVAAMAKHFPGGGPQLDGEDPHFPYGREQIYPGGRFDEHLIPFERAIASGVSALMPYYGLPVDLVVDGEPVEPIGFGFNRQILTGFLRERLGYDGVICTDWCLITGDLVWGKWLPARAHGAEDLTEYERVVKVLHAGADQFGGESCPDLVLRALDEGLITSERLDASVRRLLRVKFQLGLFDDPFVDEDAAVEVVGCAEFRAAGRRAQAESMVVLRNDGGLLPLAGGRRVYAEGLAEDEARRLGEVVADPSEADVIVVRLPCPYQERDDLFLESFFHQGTLEYRPGLLWHLRDLARHAPLVVVPNLERPAILTPLTQFASAIVGEFGSGAAAVVDVLSGAVAPLGRLPFEIPRSMDAVRASASDVANDTVDPVFEHGFGLRY